MYVPTQKCVNQLKTTLLPVGEVLQVQAQKSGWIDGIIAYEGLNFRAVR